MGWAEKVQSHCVYTVMKLWVSSPRGERKEREEKMAQNWTFRNLKFSWLGSES